MQADRGGGAGAGANFAAYRGGDRAAGAADPRFGGGRREEGGGGSKAALQGGGGSGGGAALASAADDVDGGDGPVCGVGGWVGERGRGAVGSAQKGGTLMTWEMTVRAWGSSFVTSERG